MEYLLMLSRITFLLLTIFISGAFLRYERWEGPVHSPTYKYENGNIHYEWNPATESWLNFHVRICGVFCNGTELIELLGGSIDPICDYACFPCDCNLTCPIYGTCCPSIDPRTPLAEADRKQKYYSGDTVVFVGNLTDYDFVDKNGYQQFVDERPDLIVDPFFEGKFSCLPTAWKLSGIDRHYAIATCPVSVKNETLCKLCETTDANDITVDVATPVLDTRNGIVFKNRFCLQCNAFNTSENDAFLHLPVISNASTSPYRKWKVGIFCKHYQQFYTLESSDAFLRTVLKDIFEKTHAHIQPQCEVSFVPPISPVSPRICDKIVSSESPQGEVHPTSECILDSGVFRNIHHFCHSVKYEAYRFYQRQNVFCYMCKDDFPYCVSGSGMIGEMYVTNPFSFLLGESSAIKYNTPEPVDHGDSFLCEKPLNWMDDMYNCQDPECGKGKKVFDVTSGKCQSIVKVINNLGYKLTMILKPTQDITDTNAVTFIESVALDFFRETHVTGAIDISMVVFGARNSDQENFVEYILINGSVVSTSGDSRDDFENDFLSYPFKLSFLSDQPRNITLAPIFLGRDMKKFVKFPFGESKRRHPSSEVISTIKSFSRAFTIGPSSETATNKGRRLSKSKDWHQRAVLKYVSLLQAESIRTKRSPGNRLRKRYLQNIDYNKPKASFIRDKRDARSIWDMKDSFIDLTHSVVCPHVTFDIVKINSSLKKGEILVEFNYHNKKYIIDVASSYYRDSVSIINRKVKICIGMFRKEFQNVKDYDRSNSTFSISLTEKAKRYFTLACFVFSAVCLGLTIVTYALLSQLRTLPGLNTLMLSITLAVAHIFLVVVVETLGFIKGWVCMGLGLGLHYSWLVACQWMGVCCYHMFTVFRGTGTRSNSASSKKRFEWYCFYTFGSSAVIVALTVIISEIASGSKSMGYSPVTCIFDNSWSYLVALISFVLPVSLISFSNLVMFLMTIKEIINVTRLQENGRMKGRAGVITYVKLSSLTGLFWLLVILAAKLNNTVLDFISIPFMALQGVFIFFSFTFNNTTRKLYSQYLSKSSHASDTTSTSTTRVSLFKKEENPEKVAPANV